MTASNKQHFKKSIYLWENWTEWINPEISTYKTTQIGFTRGNLPHKRSKKNCNQNSTGTVWSLKFCSMQQVSHSPRAHGPLNSRQCWARLVNAFAAPTVNKPLFRTTLEQTATFPMQYLNISKLSSLLYRVLDFITLAALKTLYYSFIHPHFLYGIISGGSVAKRDFESIFRMQKKTVRMLTRSPRYAHNDHIFANNDKLKLSNILKF